MTVRHYDYDALEREYIRGKMSIRALCRAHDIKGYSTVAEYARSHGWYEKREKILERAGERTVERLAERISEEQVDLLSQVREEMITVVRAAIYKFAEDLKDPTYRVYPKDLIELMKQGLLLLGEPTERTEEKTLALTGNLANLPPDLVREIASAAREARAQRNVTGPAGDPVPTLHPGTRTN